MRVIARRHGVDPGSLSPHELIQTLREKGNLSEEQSDELDEFHTARNRIAQGLRALKMPLKQVYRLLEITRHLLDRRPDCRGSLSTLRDMVEPIIEDLSELPNQIQAASELLREILGTSAGEVSVEWDRATDWNNRTIVTLTLSDLFGKVMATLDLGELTDRTRLLLRLPGLWRDLLRIRCQQYEKDISELVAQFAGAA